jgi:hypothetical protein
MAEIAFELEKKYAPALESIIMEKICFVRSDFSKMKCVCKTQMMPPRLTIKILWTCTPPSCV